MDIRFVIPKDMRENVLRAILSGHAGRDAMLREISDIWWLLVHREFVEKPKNCSQSQQAGKNVESSKSQNTFGKIPKSNKQNEENALDFAGPFQIAIQKKTYLPVSVDNHSGWPDALSLPNPIREKVIEFVSEYIAANGLPKRNRTNPGTVVISEKISQFCVENFIQLRVCPVRDHR